MGDKYEAPIVCPNGHKMSIYIQSIFTVQPDSLIKVGATCEVCGVEFTVDNTGDTPAEDATDD